MAYTIKNQWGSIAIRASGGSITIVFDASNFEVNGVERVATRVTQGGLNIPEDVTRRRLAQGIRYIIIQTYLPFCLMKVKYMRTPVSHSSDPDLQKVTQALFRAGEKARQLSKQLN